MHAAKIWDTHFAHDPLSRKGGDKFTPPYSTLHFPAARHYFTILYDFLLLILLFTALPPNLLVGDVIWQRMLRHGAGRDSKEMLQDLEKP